MLATLYNENRVEKAGSVQENTLPSNLMSFKRVRRMRQASRPALQLVKFWTTTTRFFALAVLPWSRSITQTRSALRQWLDFTRSVISARGATTRVEKHRCHAHCEIRRRGAHFSFGGHRDRHESYLSWPGHTPYSRRRAAIKAARAQGAPTSRDPLP